ncbi:hypothetical protein Srot_2871 [Segniliparus rotundus DSM 44985]|uniref:Secreted protein n=1 Tax=Segniliparus rotundus (strain ATCC BAA-972 / CDC 1076 / CIP 108378 / DSM 44985 / JCM 13578) TaxID=640132 RepID=D6ZDP5_SEGRD|nr:hypothetical protein [Segniliparus rotundus]ADG99302.1 hypothetical protein Srot_2871 [Segniliparus rotundus DSM 44985]
MVLVVAVCAAAAGLPVAGFARADGDDGGVLVDCLLPVSEPPRSPQLAKASDPVMVPVNRLVGVSLGLDQGGGWDSSFVNQYGELEQHKVSDDGSSSQVVVLVLTARDPAALRALFDSGRGAARATAFGRKGGATEVINDTDVAGGGAPSWIVRTRETSAYPGLLCSVEESTEREILFTLAEASYLVIVRGLYLWDRLSPDRVAPDSDAADGTYEHVRDRLAIYLAG